MKINVLTILVLLINLSVSAKPIKVMLLTGQTDKWHTWEITSAYLKGILDYGNIFETDIVLIPSDSEMMGFAPEFSKYQVVVLNQNSSEWPDDTKKAFVEFVKNGGGVVVAHEASNAFRDWKEYNKITGLGGWGGRDEKAGSYYYWKDGKFITDDSPGRTGHHGKRTPFVITIRDTEHPITKGLPLKWLHPKDELYGDFRGPAPAENVHVLATAFSDKKTNGTGKEEPLLFTINYGKGRVVHTTLGHTRADLQESVQDIGFQTIISRGAEWAATGKVTQPLPSDFPTETEIKLRDLKELGQDAGPWLSLFNGKDLKGWDVKCIPEDSDIPIWSVSEGTIMCHNAGRTSKDYVWLQYNKEYADFELKLKVQAYKEFIGNSGVQVRSRYTSANPAENKGAKMNGPQIDIDPKTGWRTGLVYDETRDVQRWIFPSLPNWNIDESSAPKEYKFEYGEGNWNELYIICKGTSIVTYLNGIKVAYYDGKGHLDDENHNNLKVGLNGYIALQIHKKHNAKVKFKDIYIREIYK